MSHFIENPDPKPDQILDSPHLSQRQKEDALVDWMLTKFAQATPKTQVASQSQMTHASSDKARKKRHDAENRKDPK
jgi:hypothetical protein